MLIRYFDTLYNRESSYRVADDTEIEFKNGRVCFSWCGSRMAIEVERVIAIERINDGI